VSPSARTAPPTPAAAATATAGQEIAGQKCRTAPAPASTPTAQVSPGAKGRANAIGPTCNSRITAMDISTANVADVPTSAQVTARTPAGALSTHAPIISGTSTRSA